MILDPVNVVWVFIGIMLWPELTFCIILWMLGHPVLGVLALLCTWANGERIVSSEVRKG